MYVQRLKIENLRSLASVDLSFNTPDAAERVYPNVNVVLGDNGVGKTSVLRAVALSALGPLMSGASGYVPDTLIRKTPGAREKRRTAIEATLALGPEETASPDHPPLPGNLRLTTIVESVGTTERLRWRCSPTSANKAVEHRQFDEGNRAFFVAGYGAGRRVESSTRVDESARSKSRLRRYERVASLFEEHVSLMPLSYWLPEYQLRNKGRYVQVVRLMNELLPAACRMAQTPTQTDQGNEHLFSMHGIDVPFRALSDGYRAYVGWIGDLLFHLCMGAPSGVKLRDTRGVVLIDEVDLHLHPEWQRVVVPTLARALPKVQFVITTHSPLVVGSLQSGNLFLLEELQGATALRRLPERVHGRSAEQILLSPYFGLQSTRAPEVAQALEVLANRASQGDRSASAQYLELLSNGLVREDVADVVRKASAGRRSSMSGKAS